MSEFFQSWSPFFALIALVVINVVYIIRSNRSGVDELDDRVIKRYKEINEDLEGQVENLETKVATQQRELDQLKGRNSTLEDLIKGGGMVGPALKEILETSFKTYHEETLALMSTGIEQRIAVTEKLFLNSLLALGVDIRDALKEAFPHINGNGDEKEGDAKGGS